MKSASALGLIRQVAIYEKLPDAIVWFFCRLRFVPRIAFLRNIVHRL